MSKKNATNNWKIRNPHAESARFRQAGVMRDRRERRAQDAGRNWRNELEDEILASQEDCWEEPTID